MMVLRNAVLCAVVLAAGAFAGKDFVMAKAKGDPSFTPKEGKALLLVMRTTSYAFAMPTDNFIDAKWIGQTKKKSYYLADVEPGTHYVNCAWDNKLVATEKVTFEAGKIYFLVQVLWPTGPFSTGLAIGGMSDKDVRGEIGECKFLQVDPDDMGEELPADVYKKAVDEFEKECTEDPKKHKEMLEYQGYSGFQL